MQNQLVLGEPTDMVKPDLKTVKSLSTHTQQPQNPLDKQQHPKNVLLGLIQILKNNLLLYPITLGLKLFSFSSLNESPWTLKYHFGLTFRKAEDTK